MSEYLRQTGSGVIFVATPALLKRPDMVPCPPPGQVEEDKPESSPEPVQEAAPVQIDFESMTKQEIESYCKQHFQVDMDRRKSKQDLIDEAHALVKESDYAADGA